MDAKIAVGATGKMHGEGAARCSLSPLSLRFSPLLYRSSRCIANSIVSARAVVAAEYECEEVKTRVRLGKGGIGATAVVGSLAAGDPDRSGGSQPTLGAAVAKCRAPQAPWLRVGRPSGNSTVELAAAASSRREALAAKALALTHSPLTSAPPPSTLATPCATTRPKLDSLYANIDMAHPGWCPWEGKSNLRQRCLSASLVRRTTT